jgi:hypothetical protein
MASSTSASACLTSRASASACLRTELHRRQPIFGGFDTRLLVPWCSPVGPWKHRHVVFSL